MVSFTVPRARPAERTARGQRDRYDESRSRTGVNLTVKGRNLVLTEAISAYAEEKIGQAGQVPRRRVPLRSGALDREEPEHRRQPGGRSHHLHQGPGHPGARGVARHLRLHRPGVREAGAPGQEVPRQAGSSHSGRATRRAFVSEGFAAPRGDRGGRGRSPSCLVSSRPSSSWSSP